MRSPAEHPGEDQGRYNGRIAFDHELGCVHIQLSPGDFLVGYRA